jgi:chromosome partitioning protein
MIISVTSLKGGVGKSTIAQNLAICFAHAGYKVAIADADTNQSSLRWSGLRKHDIPIVAVFGLPDGNSLSANIKPLNKDYDIVIIDGTPALSKLTSKIILLADIVIIPVLPGVLDIWATEMFVERHQEAVELRGKDIPAYFLLNRFKPNTNFSKEVKDVLQETTIPTLNTTLNDRIAYAEAVVGGLGVYEHKDEKAKQEMTALFNEISGIISKL